MVGKRDETVYLIVTADITELTVAVLDTIRDVVRWTGFSRSNIYRLISKGCDFSLRGRQYKIREVSIGEE